MSNAPNILEIMQIASGYRAAKVLLSAVELKLFSLLGSSELTADDIASQVGLAERGIYDFLDCLVSIGLLHRNDETSPALYGNSSSTATFLDENKPHYVGGILEMANDHLYDVWGKLTTALTTGNPIVHGSEGNPFDQIYSDPARVEQFLGAMRSVQMGAFQAATHKIDFTPFEKHCDIGGASGALAAEIARTFPHIETATFDLPVVAPIAEQYVASQGMKHRVRVLSGNFFEDDFPEADVITMGNILHDWSQEQKELLITKAFRALPAGGKLIAIENVIDDDRNKNTAGLLMSLQMLLETPDGFDYTGKQFDQWALAAGFTSTEKIELRGSVSAVVANK